jgi:hypothetical protein
VLGYYTCVNYDILNLARTIMRPFEFRQVIQSINHALQIADFPTQVYTLIFRILVLVQPANLPTHPENQSKPLPNQKIRSAR